ncbi:MAG: YtxH domain-containing protein [Chthonomonadales bacterium]|nr:YtxH domain-containing protein [Chthonomonadales bacterium]
MASDDESSAIGTSLVVFLLGVAVGAAVAILYAPMAGRETRAHIAETAERVKERASEVGHQVAEKASEIREKVAQVVRHGEEEETSAPEAS